MLPSSDKKVWFTLILLGLVVLGIFLTLPVFLSSTHYATSLEGVDAATEDREPAVVHLATPEPLKAIYMTACVAATPSWRSELKKLIDETELNAIVIDIKDYTGHVAFDEESHCFVRDLKEFIQELHNSRVYVIGRISVFQDSLYTARRPDLAVKSLSTGGVWKDRKGISFIDVGAREYWDYIVELSKESYALGFDEINYDYIRYPSDGNMADTHYTFMNASSSKPEMLKGFFEYLAQEMSGVGAKLSADLFGMTTTVATDMNIGQILENALPYFDYIAPMVYPSHYPPNWEGLSNPAEYPYEVIKISMTGARKKEEVWRMANGIATTTASKMRPWLQDFHLGATYGPDKVRAQIQATYDVGLSSWMLWSAGNRYTKDALHPESSL